MKTDFIIVGSGIAGLNFAINASKYGKVLLITKKRIIDANTNFAQGGIAAVLSKEDNFSSHIEDTLKAGSFHNDKEAVEFLVKNGPKAIEKLKYLGMKFASENEEYSLTREGGHAHRRVAFYKDETGRKIEETLIDKVEKNPDIEIRENVFALDLITKDNDCIGLKAFFGKTQEPIFAKITAIATGGNGMIFEKTTNPKIATGDGLAMAIRSGIKTKDLEFIQFHPTSLDFKNAPHFLLSEALRGEGAILLNENGERFMEGVHPQTDLAPRDIVSRAVFAQKKAFLDITHKDSEKIKNRFPMIYKKLKKYGLDLTRDLIPISAAAHYACGGIKTNTAGETSMKHLLAFGEVACTGVHGANRLASNSLLEAVVFSEQIEEIIKRMPKKISQIKIDELKLSDSRKSEKIRGNTRKTMWEKVGVLRKEKELAEAKKDLSELLKKSQLIKNKSVYDFETENIITVALETAKSAFKRKKSLGTHYLV